jgi:thiol-disulfide isomerase/thioredoxin
MNSPLVLTVYSRSYCHLCDDMIDQLEPLAAELGFQVDVVDVDSEPSLEAHFGQWVPVLMAGGIEICHYHLDVGKVRAHLVEPR